MPPATGGATRDRCASARFAKGKLGSGPGGAATGREDPGYHSQALPELLPAMEALARRGEAPLPSGTPSRSGGLPASPEGRTLRALGTGGYFESYILGGESR